TASGAQQQATTMQTAMKHRHIGATSPVGAQTNPQRRRQVRLKNDLRVSVFVPQALVKEKASLRERGRQGSLQPVGQSHLKPLARLLLFKGVFHAQHAGLNLFSLEHLFLAM